MIRQILKWALVLVALVGVAIIGYAVIGDFSAPGVATTRAVTIDVN